jgi:formamidopyrimidine-DNA glycosylase
VPELPEVETVRRGLEPAMAGARFLEVEQRRLDLRFPLPARFAPRLTGRTVERLTRRGKYLLAHLDDGEVLVMHLGMTGRFTVESGGASAKQPGGFTHAAGRADAHDHIVFTMSSGATVTFNDARRFGYMDLVDAAGIESHKLFCKLGVEPLSNGFDAVYLAARARDRHVDLKALLLDQHVIAGLGNIYVSEALYRSGQKPTRAAASLATRSGRPAPRTEELVVAIRAVLTDAIEAGGSTLRDYRHADGSLGYFQKAHDVYDREGEPCHRPGCTGVIRRLVQAGRSTFYCPRCQR